MNACPGTNYQQMMKDSTLWFQFVNSVPNKIKWQVLTKLNVWLVQAVQWSLGPNLILAASTKNAPAVKTSMLWSKVLNKCVKLVQLVALKDHLSSEWLVWYNHFRSNRTNVPLVPTLNKPIVYSLVRFSTAVSAQLKDGKTQVTSVWIRRNGLLTLANSSI